MDTENFTPNYYRFEKITPRMRYPHGPGFYIQARFKDDHFLMLNAINTLYFKERRQAEEFLSEYLKTSGNAVAYEEYYVHENHTT